MPARLQDKAFIAVLLLLSLTAAAIGIGRRELDAPPETPGREKSFSVEQGQGFPQVVQRLESEGLIRSAWYARLLAKVRPGYGRLRAGEFLLNTGWDARHILDALSSGPFFLHRIVIPEGYAWWQTARAVEATGLTTFENFTEAMRDKELLRKYGIPADTAEGYLFPETYLLPRPQNKDARPIVEGMLKEFRTRTQALYAAAFPGKPMPAPWAMHQLVILASIVERETADPAERPRIAGVFMNRLKRNMLLQSDPTIIYGLGEGFEGPLRRKNLDDERNPYNTYKFPGLTPGPICSPGAASIKAVMQPENTSFLYFVSKGDGTHSFSDNLETHNAAVRKYQLGKQQPQSDQQ